MRHECQRHRVFGVGFQYDRAAPEGLPNGQGILDSDPNNPDRIEFEPGPFIFKQTVWFLARRDWKAIFGMAIGGVSLIMIGLIQDPLWIDKFRGASAAVMDRTQGIQSNVWAFAYLICKGAAPCSTLLGGTLALILLGLGGFFLWQQAARVKVTAWEAFNVILPIAFVSTIYLWAYDQLVYIIPIVWIVGTLVERTKSYVYAFLFLITLDMFSLYALSQHASTSKDLWSLGTTIIVLGMVMGLLLHRIKLNSTKDIPLHA